MRRNDAAQAAVQMQIGEVAARTELSIATVRHYDEVGLVTPSARSAGGFRLYTEADVERLLVIRRMKPLGFSLSEMSDLLASFDVLDDSRASKTQRSTAAQHLRNCQSKAAESSAKLRKQLAYAAKHHFVAAPAPLPTCRPRRLPPRTPRTRCPRSRCAGRHPAAPAIASHCARRCPLLWFLTFDKPETLSGNDVRLSSGATPPTEVSQEPRFGRIIP
jgi:MerR family transcriptional regulator, copper efflux regulator